MFYKQADLSSNPKTHTWKNMWWCVLIRVIPALGKQRDCRIPVAHWSNSVVYFVSSRSVRNLISSIKNRLSKIILKSILWSPHMLTQVYKFIPPTPSPVWCNQSTYKSLYSELNFYFSISNKWSQDLKNYCTHVLLAAVFSVVTAWM